MCLRVCFPAAIDVTGFRRICVNGCVTWRSLRVYIFHLRLKRRSRRDLWQVSEVEGPSVSGFGRGYKGVYEGLGLGWRKKLHYGIWKLRFEGGISTGKVKRKKDVSYSELVLFDLLDECVWKRIETERKKNEIIPSVSRNKSLFKKQEIVSYSYFSLFFCLLLNN